MGAPRGCRGIINGASPYRLLMEGRKLRLVLEARLAHVADIGASLKRGLSPARLRCALGGAVAAVLRAVVRLVIGGRQWRCRHVRRRVTQKVKAVSGQEGGCVVVPQAGGKA